MGRASNMSIKSMDHELDDTILADDVMITTGNGALLKGEEEVRKYVARLEEYFYYQDP